MLVNILINLHILFGLLLDAQSKFSKHANGFVAHCMPLASGQSTRRLCDVPLAVPKGVAERSGGNHTKQVLSPLSF